MKKLALILGMFICVFALNAQTSSNITDKGSKVYASGSDTIVAATSYTFYLKDVKAPFYYNYTVKLTDHSGGNTASLAFYGSTNGGDFKLLQTIAYAGTGTDTTIIVSQASTPIFYDAVKFTVTPSDTMLLKRIDFRKAEIK